MARAHSSSCALVVALLLVCASCGGDDDCEIVCAKNAECQPDAPPKDQCVATCNKLSEDDSYASALAYEADCYDSATCRDIADRKCEPK